jgi:hypothetical protein
MTQQTVDEPSPGAATGRWWRLMPLAMGAVAAVAILAHLFVGGTVGQADNGDGPRLTCQLGVDAQVPEGAQRYLGHVLTQFEEADLPPELCSEWGTTWRYPSTEVPVLRVASAVGGWVGLSSPLDLRVLGVLCALVFGAAIGLIAWLLPGSGPLRLGAALALTVLAGDSAFVPYFISTYSEPAAFLGLLLLCAAWLWVPQRAGVQVLSVLAIVAAASFLVFSKSQTLPVLVVLLPALAWRATQLADVRSRWVVKGVALVAGLVLVFGAVRFTDHVPNLVTRQNAYNAVFYTLLGHSDDPRGDLRDLGLDEDLATYAGTQFWDPTSGYSQQDPRMQAFASEFSYLDLGLTYLRQPARAFGLLQRSTDAVATMRTGYIGNLSPGEPATTLTHRVTLLSGTVSALAGVAWLLLPLLWAGAATAGVLLARRRRHERSWRALGELVVVLAAISVVKFGVVTLAEGDTDNVRHHIIDGFSTAVLLPFLVVALVGLQRASPATGAAATPPRPDRSPA